MCNYCIMKINKFKKTKRNKNRRKTLKKKGGGTEEIKKFLHYIVNNKYPEDVAIGLLNIPSSTHALLLS